MRPSQYPIPVLDRKSPLITLQFLILIIKRDTLEYSVKFVLREKRQSRDRLVIVDPRKSHSPLPLNVWRLSQWCVLARISTEMVSRVKWKVEEGIALRSWCSWWTRTKYKDDGLLCRYRPMLIHLQITILVQARSSDTIKSSVSH